MHCSFTIVCNRMAPFCFHRDAGGTGQDADTDNSEEAKNSAHAMNILPFLLPPIGIIFLATISYAVVTIRNWQKIPSMPTQGRMDIEAVRASAQQAGGRTYEQREMKHASAALR
jgi:hypothetical protein